MKEENKGLVSKAAGAIAGVINTIRKLKDLLLGVLARAAAAIGLIIKDPIGFLGNMVSAVKLGLQNFIGNIGAHMKQGFMDWLFGAVAEAGIQLPKTFDLKGILSLVMQVLGLTWTAIRARAVAILGEKVVSAIETTVDIIKKVITEGPGALWDWLKEKVGDLKAMVLDQLQDFIVTRVIMAGITWLVGLLNPASAFIKACKAIYDIIMFFVERGSQILALVNAVIDSITAIAQGALGGAAAMVENALAKGIPVVIGFLASLLGLGGISDKIKSVIEAIRKPIGEAIDWVIHKAVSLLKAGGKFIAGLFGKKDKATDKETGKDVGDPKNIAREALLSRLGSETTLDRADSVVPAIRQELRPVGLQELEVGPEQEDGSRAIYAAASLRKIIAKLAGRRVTVAMSAKIMVQDRPVEPTKVFPQRPLSTGGEIVKGLGIDFRPFEKSRIGAFESSGRTEMLPEVTQPSWVPARKGNQPSSGMIIEPAPTSTRLEVVSWNTGNRIGRKIGPREYDSNVSHAEHQFTEWFSSRDQAWLRRVVSVEVTVEGKPICIGCEHDLKSAKALIGRLNPSIHFDWSGPALVGEDKLEVTSS